MLEKYIGTKIITAEPQERLQAPGEDEATVDSKGHTEAGYKVVYPDGYVSWSPKEVFEGAYRRTDALPFALAIEGVRQGLKLARHGWHGKDMYIYHVPGAVWDDPCLHPMQEFVAMYTGKDKDVPWLCSQTDMLMDDWFLVEEDLDGLIQSGDRGS